MHSKTLKVLYCTHRGYFGIDFRRYPGAMVGIQQGLSLYCNLWNGMLCFKFILSLFAPGQEQATKHFEFQQP